MKNNKLFIIGNGFDIAHERKTKYQDFEQFLKDNLEQHNFPLDKFEEKVEQGLSYNNNDNEKKSLWSNIEYAFECVFDKNIIYDNMEEYRNLNVSYGSDDFRSRDYHSQEIAIEEDYMFCWKISTSLEPWIASVNDIMCCEKYLLNNSENDLFLSFNYTDTLETCYKIKPQQILYIHGRYPEKLPLIIGHNTEPIVNKAMEDDLYEDVAGNRQIHQAQAVVYKNTNKIIKENKSFFEKLSSVNEIYILGHSMSEIDIEYFLKIKECVELSTKWFISYYEDNDKKNKEDICKNLEVDNLELKKMEELFLPFEK